MKAELQRRHSHTLAVLDLLKSQPRQWIDIHAIAAVGGFASWRTRVSEARAIAEAHEHATVEWNGSVKASAYRYRPLPLGRDAAVPVTQTSLPGF